MTQRGGFRPVSGRKYKKIHTLITGTTLHCKSWQTEGALRMLHNVLNPEVAKDPEHLIVYGGTGRAARSWEALEAIEESLKNLEDDDTLLVRSGRPVAIS